jgi:hypothetical protein
MKNNGKIVMLLVVMFFLVSQFSYGRGKTDNSYNEKPFMNPIAPTLPFNGDTSGPAKVSWPEEGSDRNPFGDPFQKLQKTSISEKKEDKIANKNERQQAVKKIFQELNSGNDIASGLFSYTGFSWNGCDYTGILSYSEGSYIIRKGDKLKEGYKVLYLDEKEVAMSKDGKKITVKFRNDK